MEVRESKAEYEHEWNRCRARIEARVSEGERDPVQILQSVWRQDRVEMSGMEELAAYQPPGRHLCVKDGAYAFETPGERIEHEVVVSTLAAYVRDEYPDVEAIVELGAGIAPNLFLLHDELAEPHYQGLAYHAFEYTEAGRSAARYLRNVGSIGNLEVHTFDFNEPDLSPLQGKRRLLFFTCHSIEQVTDLPGELIGRMLSAGSDVRCFHFEPVGWQLDERLAAWRKARDSHWLTASQLFRRLGWRAWAAYRKLAAMLGVSDMTGARGIKRRAVIEGDKSRVSRHGAVWSALRNYNRNLVELLAATEKKGLIRIFRMDANRCGSNPFNPTSIIGWMSARDRRE